MLPFPFDYISKSNEYLLIKGKGATEDEVMNLNFL